MERLVSIGMPAFNEAAHIGEAIASLLGQTYPHFELIISDNASTDGTYDIILDHAARDPRIKPVRNERNVGALSNFASVRDRACGEYFMWAGAHDRWHPSFISKLVPVLENDPRVVLAYPLSMLIDAEGRELGIMSDRIDTRGLAAAERFRKFVSEIRDCNMLHGLIRRRVVADLKCKAVWGSDILLLAELALRGSFAQLPEVLFYRRQVRDEVYLSDEYKRRLWTALDPARAERKAKLGTTAMLRQLRNELAMAALKSPELKMVHRVQCMKATGRFGGLNPFAAKLAHLVLQIGRVVRCCLAAVQAARTRCM